jgi:NADH-quinone oxidoreductase subunit H
MAEYGSMLSVSLLASILFLGGWHGPIPVTELLGLQPGGWLSAAIGDGGAHFVCQLIGLLNLLLKGCIGVSVMIWVRWTLPRLRIDQVMTTCLKYCTPIAAVMFLGAAAWHYWLPQRNFFGLTRAPLGVYGIDEGWPVAAAEEGAAADPSDEAPADAEPPEDQSVQAVRAMGPLLAHDGRRRSE